MKPELLVVGIKISKVERDDLQRILTATAEKLKVDIVFSILDLRNDKLPPDLPRYILAIGEQTGEYIKPQTEKSQSVVITIPRVKEFAGDLEKKAKVWTVLQGLFIDLQKTVLDAVPMVGLNKSSLVLDANVIVEHLKKPELIATFKRTLIEQGPLVIECKDGNIIHIYPDGKLPEKDKFEFTASEFFLLVSALLLFDASAAKLAKETL